MRGKQMRPLKRWMLVILITLLPAVVTGETPDASSAEVAITEAAAAVEQASIRRALWTTAEAALRRARLALQEGNVMKAIEEARVAQKHSELGIAQKDYPLFR